MRLVPRGERVPVAPNDDPGPYGSLADIPGHRPLVGVRIRVGPTAYPSCWLTSVLVFECQTHAGAHRYARRAIVCRESLLTRSLVLGKLTTALRTLTSTTVIIIIIITVVVVMVVVVI